MTSFKTLDMINVDGKVVLLRVDYNVPMKEGRILDDSRITKTISTIQELLNKNANVVILSHFGRPKGQPNASMSLQPLQALLSEKFGIPVDFEAYPLKPRRPKSTITLLENLRFYEGEESNDPEFARMLSYYGDIYVNDAFSVSHRAHASVDRITEFLPSYAGRLMEQEVSALTKGFNGAQKPVTALVAGSKISTKLMLLENLLNTVDYLVVGGGIANTFLKAKGFSVGKSLIEESMLSTAEKILLTAESKLILPFDACVTPQIDQTENFHFVSRDAIPDDFMIVDIGPRTVNEIDRIVSISKTVVWNGPLGVFEVPPFDAGTNAVAEKIAERCSRGALYAIGGGGETVAALTATQAGSKFSYLSTAGGAFLEWLEGKELPGVKRLME